MTCRNCIHERVCSALIESGLPYNDECPAEIFCLKFKDKSKFIELPCKVGDTVYVIMDIESVHSRILEMKVLSIEIKDQISFFAKTVKKYLYNYGSFILEDIGKTVFLTRKEAEKKLKE